MATDRVSRAAGTCETALAAGATAAVGAGTTRTAFSAYRGSAPESEGVTTETAETASAAGTASAPRAARPGITLSSPRTAGAGKPECPAGAALAADTATGHGFDAGAAVTSSPTDTSVASNSAGAVSACSTKESCGAARAAFPALAATAAVAALTANFTATDIADHVGHAGYPGRAISPDTATPSSTADTPQSAGTAVTQQ